MVPLHSICHRAAREICLNANKIESFSYHKQLLMSPRLRGSHSRPSAWKSLVVHQTCNSIPRHNIYDRLLASRSTSFLRLFIYLEYSLLLQSSCTVSPSFPFSSSFSAFLGLSETSQAIGCFIFPIPLINWKEDGIQRETDRSEEACLYLHT